MTRLIAATIILAAIITALFKALTSTALTAHCPPDCWDCRPWRDVRCDRLSGEAEMLRAAGR